MIAHGHNVFNHLSTKLTRTYVAIFYRPAPAHVSLALKRYKT